MGIHVCLDILPWAIERAAWAEAYDESLAVLRAHPGGLLGLFYREVEGVKVPTYTRAIEDAPDPSVGRCWRVVGDLASRQTAEDFELYRDLRQYRRWAGRDEGDIVVVAAGDEDRPTPALFAKTQGLPHHLTVLAAAMAIETRLPRQALVSGDIDRADAERARAFAARVLGHAIALPVRVDPAALARRLAPAYRGPALLDAFARLVVTDDFAGDEPLLRVFPRRLTEPWFRTELLRADPATTGQLLVAWVDATADLAALCRLACRDPAGPRWPLERLTEELAALGVGFRAPPRGGPRGRAASTRRAAAGRPDAPAGRGARRGAAPPAAPAAVGPWLPPDVFTRLLRAAGPDDLAPADRDAVLAVTWAARGVQRRLRPALSRRRARDPAAVRRALARTVVKRGRWLTEPAWDAIRGESDARVLSFLRALCCFHYLPESRVAGAMLENLPLARFGAAAARDDLAMRRARAARGARRGSRAG